MQFMNFELRQQHARNVMTGARMKINFLNKNINIPFNLLFTLHTAFFIAVSVSY